METRVKSASVRSHGSSISSNHNSSSESIPEATGQKNKEVKKESEQLETTKNDDVISFSTARSVSMTT